MDLRRIPIWNLVRLKVRKHSDLTDVTTSQHHTKYTNAEAVAAMSGKIGEGHIIILPFSYHSIGQGTWVLNPIGTTQFLSGTFRNSTQANGDSISFKICLDAGTYTVLLFTIKDVNRGIADIDIDTVVVASFDNYNAGNIKNFRQIDTGNIIATSGLKTLTLTMNGKNPASASYRVDIGYIGLWRTA